jgi:hypothetical protein
VRETGGREPGNAASQPGGRVGFIVLITWFAAVLLGLFMLVVWLIENDVTSRGVAKSRLPSPVVFTHLLLAAAGLAMWVTYLILDRMMFAWIAIGLLGGIALLGATMFLRWIPVYRQPDRPGSTTGPSGEILAVPAEGNFPVVVVALHGVLAVSTLVLALPYRVRRGGTRIASPSCRGLG